MIFSLRKEDGAYYPIILLDGASEPFDDDACGGYEMSGDAVNEVRRSYGQGECVSQRALNNEVSTRSKA
jgi:hypothetical protein